MHSKKERDVRMRKTVGKITKNVVQRAKEMNRQTNQDKKETHTHLGKSRLLLALAWRRRVDLGDEIVVEVDRFSLLLSLV